MNERNHLGEIVLNNAEWCDIVCRTHGIPGAFADGLWVQPQPGLPLYPNVVTLSCDQPYRHHAVIANLCSALPHGVAVKDSFDRLDLTSLGLSRAFEAAWIRLDHPTTDLRRVTAPPWLTIDTDEGLARWERAWAAGGPSINRRVFLPALLLDPGIAVMAAWQDGHVVAGCIANRSTSGVVGLSNFFAPTAQRQAFREAAVRQVVGFARDRSIVGYEAAEETEGFLSLGFRTLGRLVVWVRP
ncbi:MAG: hypothetical protein EXQ94_11480 [Alphaproteobacteria bacterium]|nr:hypothetical protein [Alphaproteobacteria bacterium]